MKIATVTITGADDSISPRDLTDISKQYPFVEWGILFCSAQQGTARFPSDSWIKMLATLAKTSDPIPQISAHLSGAWLTDLLAGESKCPYLKLPMFQRIQLDFNGKAHRVDPHAFFLTVRTLTKSGQRIIFQMDGVNDYLHTLALARGIDAQALFDHSHGEGITPETWPRQLPYSMCGYAGGLKPDNLANELRRISAGAGNTSVWIDIATGSRSNDGKIFDTQKAIACLDIARMFSEEANPKKTGGP